MAWANPEYIDNEMIKVIRMTVKRVENSKYPVRIVTILPYTERKRNWMEIQEIKRTNPNCLCQELFVFPKESFGFWKGNFWITGECDIRGKAPWEVAVIMMENKAARKEFPLVKSGWEKIGLWCQRNIKCPAIQGSLLTIKDLEDSEEVYQKVVSKIGKRIRTLIGCKEKMKWINVAVCCGVYDEESLTELFEKGKEEKGKWAMGKFVEIQKYVKEWPEEMRRRDLLVQEMKDRKTKEKEKNKKCRKGIEEKEGQGDDIKGKRMSGRKNIVHFPLPDTTSLQKMHNEIRKRMKRGLLSQDIGKLMKKEHSEWKDHCVLVEEPDEPPRKETERILTIAIREEGLESRTLRILDDDDGVEINLEAELKEDVKVVVPEMHEEQDEFEEVVQRDVEVVVPASRDEFGDNEIKQEQNGSFEEVFGEDNGIT